MITIDQILTVIDAKEMYLVNENTQINELIQLDVRNQRDDVLMWVSPKNMAVVADIQKGTIICAKIDATLLQKGCNYLFTDNPRNAFRLILNAFFAPKQTFSVSKTANIHPSVKLGKTVFIGENVVIEQNCQLGENVVIGHNTVLHANTVVKNGVQIGCNCVVGSVGFGYEKDEKGAYIFIPHIGNVVLEEGVEIGNCTVIDRAVMGSTILRNNVKVDNLVHIAHGVVIGENSLIIANAMVGGSTKIGKNVWVAPSSTLINKIEIGDNAVIGLGAVVVKSVQNDAIVVGNPARPLEKRKD
jgi:UDP-3-O-[3-hydroxymyristoyl] glucosamine N-acyltransferase